MSTAAEVVELTSGPSVEVQHIEAVGADTGRFEIETESDDDQRRWRVDISRDATYEIVRAWDGDIIVDGDDPDWMPELVTLALSA